MATSVRTVTCTYAEWLEDPMLVDALPRLEKLILDDSALPDGAAQGPLSRVRDMSNGWAVTLEDLHRATRRGGVLGNVERYTRICSDGFVRVDRRVLDSLTPAHVDQGLLSEEADNFEVDPLVRAFGVAPTLTDHESAFVDALFDALSAFMPDEDTGQRSVIPLYVAWLHAASDPTA